MSSMQRGLQISMKNGESTNFINVWIAEIFLFVFYLTGLWQSSNNKTIFMLYLAFQYSHSDLISHFGSKRFEGL